MPPSKAVRGGPDGQPNRIASNTLRWIVLAGAAWQLLSGKLPLGHAVYDQIRGIGADHLSCLKKCLGRASGFLDFSHSVWSF